MTENQTEKCDHELRTVNGKVGGHGSITTGVVLECEKCGGLKYEKREKIGGIND